jgi:hypothetical protein
MQNRGLLKKNTSGYTGVCFLDRRSSKKWRAGIRVDGQFKLIGYFLTPEEAARARDKAAITAYGCFAVLNFPSNDTVDGQAVEVER